VFADCPNGSKSDGFILNWQAKLFRQGIAFCHCSKTGQFPVWVGKSEIYRKLLNSQLFEEAGRALGCLRQILSLPNMPRLWAVSLVGRNCLKCLILRECVFSCPVDWPELQKKCKK
jgi:hypothetical protein